MKSRTGVIAVIASVLTLAGNGVAVADTVPQEQEKETYNNYHLRLSMEDVAIQSVPNMAAAPLVREGFITGTTKFQVECRPKGDKGGNAVCPDILQASLTVSAQIGCPMDLSGGLENIGATGTLTAGLPRTLGELVPTNGDLTTIGIAPTLQNLGPGNLNALFSPGSINDIEIGQESIPASLEELQKLQQVTNLANAIRTKVNSDMTLGGAGIDEDLKAVGQRVEAVLNQKATDGGLVVSVKNRHVVIDRMTKPQGAGTACGGPVAIRMYATGTIRTATSSDKMDMYGDIYTL